MDDDLFSCSSIFPIFCRSKYNGIDDWVVDLGDTINRAGSFEFYIEYSVPEGAEHHHHHQLHRTLSKLGLEASPLPSSRCPTVRSYTRTFNVEPQLKLAGEELELGNFHNCEYAGSSRSLYQMIC